MPHTLALDTSRHSYRPPIVGGLTLVDDQYSSMPIVDMHGHSTESDGAQNPSEIYTRAREIGVRIMAITDHDIVTRTGRRTGWDPDHQQLILHGAEVSVTHAGQSLHILVYARHLGERVDSVLSGIRHGKMSKIRSQCTNLGDIGCRIQLMDGSLMPFSIEELSALYPGTRPDGYNNGHLVQTILAYPDNMRVIQRVAPDITPETLMVDGFKRGGRYLRQISLPEDLPPYEPSLATLVSTLDMSDTIVSLAHPHKTFGSIGEFRDRIGDILDAGVSAIEIGVTASREWVRAIRVVARENRGVILTAGSDSHDIYGVGDRDHARYGTMNPYLTRDEVGEMIEDIRMRVGGEGYRRAAYGIFS